MLKLISALLNVKDRFTDATPSLNETSKSDAVGRSLVMFAPPGDGCCGGAILPREGRAPHLLTPSTGIVTEYRTTAPAPEYCHDCKQPKVTYFNGRGLLFRCITKSCPQTVRRDERIDTSFVGRRWI